MSVAVTVDLDWACEPAIAELLDYLRGREIPTTVFVTHRSRRVESAMHELEVGLHPNFARDSSHGETLDDVIEHVLALPHNLPAYRCHRFAASNEISERLAEAGMKFASNVCTDLHAVAPFRDRSGVWQYPVFLEDGGYLRRGHPLFLDAALAEHLAAPGLHVLLLHPMHFALNTPDFAFMRRLKDSMTRSEWREFSYEQVTAHRHCGAGVREFVTSILDHVRDRGIPLTTLGREHDRADSRAP